MRPVAARPEAPVGCRLTLTDKCGGGVTVTERETGGSGEEQEM